MHTSPTPRDPLPRPPRPVPWATRLALLSHGPLAIFAAIFTTVGCLATGMVIGLRSLLVSAVLLMGTTTAPGTVVSVDSTGVSVNEDNVWKVIVDVDGRRVSGFGSAPVPSVGDAVVVDVSSVSPELMQVEELWPQPVPLWPGALVLVFPVVGLGFTVAQVRRGRRWIQVLVWGQTAEGTLVKQEPSGLTVNDVPEQKLTFHFQDDRGDTWPVEAKSLDPARLRDEATERVLFHPAHPDKALVLDELPTWLTCEAIGWTTPPVHIGIRAVALCTGWVIGPVLGLALSLLSH